MPARTTVPPTSAAAGLADRRLDTPVRELMRPGVIALSDDASLRQAERAMVRHGVHAVLLLGRCDARPVGWVTTRGLLAWLDHDLGLVPAGQAVDEPVTYISPSATAKDAVAALADPAVSHLLVARAPGETPQGVVADIDIVSHCTGEHQRRAG